MPVAVDSNILWDLLGGDRELSERLIDAGGGVIPLPVLAEARYTVLNSRYAAQNHERLQRFLRESTVHPLSENTARIYAEVRYQLKLRGRPIAMNDLWIAAVCLEHDLPLVTRDSDFDRVEGLTVLRW